MNQTQEQTAIIISQYQSHGQKEEAEEEEDSIQEVSVESRSEVVPSADFRDTKTVF